MAKNASKEYIFPILYVQLVLQKLIAKTASLTLPHATGVHFYLFLTIQYSKMTIAKAWNSSEKRGTKDKFM